LILIEQQNWQGCRTAILEYENNCIYIYSYPHNDKSLIAKSLWVANTKKRIFSKSSITADAKKGLQPYMPKKLCNNAGFIKDYNNKENWFLQWGLDQNSIAVYFKNKIITILPEWSGLDGFYGYSLGCNETTALAWPLIENNEEINRFLKEKIFLDSWDDSIWVEYQKTILSTYDLLYQGETKYFAADGGKWPPLGIHYSKSPNVEFLATVGMSQLPMPLLEMKQESTESLRYIELALLFKHIDNFNPLAKYLSGQATFPWYQGAHLDHGHTIPCRELSEIGSNATFMLIVENASFLPKVPASFLGKTSRRLLFMIPIYEAELNFIKINSSDDFLKRLEISNENPLDIFRNSII